MMDRRFMFNYFKQHAYKKIVVGAVLLLITFIVFWPSLRFDFVKWDDPAYVLDNETIRSLKWSNLDNIFQESVLRVYSPLTTLSFAIEYHFVKLKPFLYHLDNVLLHLGVTGLIFSLGLRLGLTTRAAFLGGLLFGIHPIHMESVVWVTERKDVLNGIFYMAALHSWLNYIEQKRWKDYGITIIFGLLSMLAKPMAVSLPLALMLLDWFKDRKDVRTCFIEKIPFFLCCVGLAWITLKGNYGSYESAEHWPHTVLIFIWSFMFYINSFILPINLSPIYRTSEPIDLTNSVYIIAVVTFLLFIVVLMKYRKNRWFIFGVMFYVLSIFFLLRFKNLTDADIVADRFMYMPSLGFCLLFGEIIHLQLIRLEYHKLRKIFLVIVLIVVFSALGIISRHYSRAWNDNMSLWNYIIQTNPNVRIAYYNRGMAFHQQGDFRKAINDFTNGLSRFPRNLCMRTSRGLAYWEEGNLVLALEDLNHVVDHSPQSADGYYNRALVYKDLKKTDLALEDLNKALEINPKLTDAYCLKGQILNEMGDHNAALDYYNQAITLDPEYIKLYQVRGNLYFKLDSYDLALEDFNKVLAIDPVNMLSMINRAMVYTFQQKFDLAFADYENAIKIDPKEEAIYLNRAQLFELLGDFASAISDYTKLLSFSSKKDVIFYNRGVLQSKINRHDLAIADYTQAIAFNPDFELAYANRAAEYHLQNQYNQALEDYKKAVNLNPQNANYALSKLKIYEIKKNLELLRKEPLPVSKD